MHQDNSEASSTSNKASSEAIRILIADDHSFFRDGLRLLIEATDDFEVVGEVDTAVDAVDFALEIKPDVILMDIKMPPSDGIQATKEIMAVCPDIKILILTMFNDDDNVFKALQAGAKGYVLKGINQAELVCTIRLIAHGNAVYGNQIASQIRDFFSSSQNQATNQHLAELSQRENHILNLVAKGLRNKDIASECNITEKTVRNHVSSILSKLQASSRSEAIQRFKGEVLSAPLSS